MAKPELGTKRLCPSCGAKYYDLNREPITCPKCGTIFEAVMVSRAAKAAKPEETSDDDDDDDVDAAAPEIVTLEEADAEAEGGDDVPDIEGDDVDVDDDSSDDDVFLDEDDEDEDSVPGIRVEIEDDSDS
ncbi:TIGR02300 family protein [Roseibium sp. SCPC15]|uniref:TIGR02300 family protein n=1 Tax=Roseibium sp. SCP15 TaxID=3141376 RepID=UPI003337C281